MPFVNFPYCSTYIESGLVDYANEHHVEAPDEIQICHCCQNEIRIFMQRDLAQAEVQLIAEKTTLTNEVDGELENPFLYNYKSALRDYPSTKIPYGHLLQTVEWTKFRDRIKIRDDYSCQFCNVQQTNNSNFHLEVHHTFYVANFLPWEYEEADLITLCDSCHEDFHQNNRVKVYRYINEQKELLDSTTCDRCQGIGSISQYRHVSGGVCFKCEGLGYKLLPVV